MIMSSLVVKNTFVISLFAAKDFPEPGVPRIRPVSYTHLDVYKRQALFIGTVICYQDWLQAAFLVCMGGVLIFILFAGEFIDIVIDLLREKICTLILG